MNRKWNRIPTSPIPAAISLRTDEAFRMRAVDDVNRVTYKGPKIDPETKTRKEIDLSLPDGEDARVEWAGLFASLGFAPRGFVRKNRRKAFVAWHGRRVEVSLDRIDTLGEFVELELIAEEADLERTKQDIATLADHLDLHRNERRSYLELLLEAGQ